MIIKITKGRAADYLTILRHDGSVDAATFPKKGVTSHDAIHYFVETALELREGFCGMVARGNSPEDIQAMAKNAGHASASRAAIPDSGIIQLLQSERLVECFEADAWGAPAEATAFIAIARTACDTSYVPLPRLTSATIETVRSQIVAFQAEWDLAPVGHVAEFHWEEI